MWHFVRLLFVIFAQSTLGAELTLGRCSISHTSGDVLNSTCSISTPVNEGGTSTLLAQALNRIAALEQELRELKQRSPTSNRLWYSLPSPTCWDSQFQRGTAVSAAIAANEWVPVIMTCADDAQLHYASDVWSTLSDTYSSSGATITSAYSTLKVSAIKFTFNGESMEFALSESDAGKYTLKELFTQTTDVNGIMLTSKWSQYDTMEQAGDPFGVTICSGVNDGSVGPCTDRVEPKLAAASLAFNPRYYGESGSGARFGVIMDEGAGGHPGTAWGIAPDIGSWGGWQPSSGSPYPKSRSSEQVASGMINCCKDPKYFVAASLAVK